MRLGRFFLTISRGQQGFFVMSLRKVIFAFFFLNGDSRLTPMTNTVCCNECIFCFFALLLGYSQRGVSVCFFFKAYLANKATFDHLIFALDSGGVSCI